MSVWLTAQDFEDNIKTVIHVKDAIIHEVDKGWIEIWVKTTFLSRIIKSRERLAADTIVFMINKYRPPGVKIDIIMNPKKKRKWWKFGSKKKN